METFIFDWWRRSRQSLARKGLRFFRPCVLNGKMNQNPQSNYCGLTLTQRAHAVLWFESRREWCHHTVSHQQHCSSATKSKSSCRK